MTENLKNFAKFFRTKQGLSHEGSGARGRGSGCATGRWGRAWPRACPTVYGVGRDVRRRARAREGEKERREGYRRRERGVRRRGVLGAPLEQRRRRGGGEDEGSCAAVRAGGRRRTQAQWAGGRRALPFIG